MLVDTEAIIWHPLCAPEPVGEGGGWGEMPSYRVRWRQGTTRRGWDWPVERQSG